MGIPIPATRRVTPSHTLARPAGVARFTARPHRRIGRSGRGGVQTRPRGTAWKVVALPRFTPSDGLDREQDAAGEGSHPRRLRVGADHDGPLRPGRGVAGESSNHTTAARCGAARSRAFVLQLPLAPFSTTAHASINRPGPDPRRRLAGPVSRTPRPPIPDRSARGPGRARDGGRSHCKAGRPTPRFGGRPGNPP